MELENIILSELIQTQKDMQSVYSLISGYSHKVQNTHDTTHIHENHIEGEKIIMGGSRREKLDARVKREGGRRAYLSFF